MMKDESSVTVHQHAEQTQTRRDGPERRKRSQSRPQGETFKYFIIL